MRYVCSLLMVFEPMVQLMIYEGIVYPHTSRHIFTLFSQTCMYEMLTFSTRWEVQS